MGDDSLSSKQVGSQASRRITRRLGWIQPVCISINAVPALKGLTYVYTVKSRYLKVDGTIFYKFKLPEVQINLHFG